MHQGEVIRQHLQKSCQLLQDVASSLSAEIEQMATLIANALGEGKKLLIMGNGGSASQAQHMAAELVGNFGREIRRALPAIALTTDNSILTAIGNDLGFHHIFERQVEALAQKGDIVMALSTSGKSANIIWGLLMAGKKEAIPVALLGRDGGPALGLAISSIVVPSSDTALIQEAHLSILHTICREVECSLQ